MTNQELEALLQAKEKQIKSLQTTVHEQASRLKIVDSMMRAIDEDIDSDNDSPPPPTLALSLALGKNLVSDQEEIKKLKAEISQLQDENQTLKQTQQKLMQALNENENKYKEMKTEISEKNNIMLDRDSRINQVKENFNKYLGHKNKWAIEFFRYNLPSFKESVDKATQHYRDITQPLTTTLLQLLNLCHRYHVFVEKNIDYHAEDPNPPQVDIDRSGQLIMAPDIGDDYGYLYQQWLSISKRAEEVTNEHVKLCQVLEQEQGKIIEDTYQIHIHAMLDYLQKITAVAQKLSDSLPSLTFSAQP